MAAVDSHPDILPTADSRDTIRWSARGPELVRVDPELQAIVDTSDIVPVLVTGHLEKNPYNPVYAYRHLRGVGYNINAGVKRIAEPLNEETDETIVLTDRASTRIDS